MTLGIIITKDIVLDDTKTFVDVIGRLSDGSRFQRKISYRPHFFIRKSDALESRAEYEETNLCNLKGEPVIRLRFDNVEKLKEEESYLFGKKIECFESDLSQPQAFMIEKGIGTVVEVTDSDIVPVKVDDIDALKSVLVVLSIDIETNYKTNEVLCVSLVTNNGISECIITSETKSDIAKVCKTEKELLRTVFDRILEIDPDIITGWNLIDFDISVLKDRAQKNGISMNIGFGSDEIKVMKKKNFLGESKAKAKGRQILDSISLAKQAYVKLTDYKLDTAAKEILGDSKVEYDGHKGDAIIDWYNHDPEKLIEYNLKDSVLVQKILEKKSLLDIALERSLVCGVELDRVRSPVATMDSLYIHEARKRGYVLNNVGKTIKLEGISGGFVLESKPGLYDYIFVFDYKSLYPSIIRTFNIDLMSSAQAKDNYISSPNGARFSKDTEGILTDLITTIWKLRDSAKKKKDPIKTYALKVTMNSFFGVLANPNCRYFNYDVADSITSFGRLLIKETMDFIRKKGYTVIYGDTDSLFVESRCKSNAEAKELGEKLMHEINSYFKEKIKSEYGRTSHLQIQFEKIFIKFFMPTVRGSESGAKKRYAGLLLKEGHGDKKDSEEIFITGLEFVRSDWTDLAKKFQFHLLECLFHNKAHKKFIKDTIKSLNSGEFDNDIIYRKKLTKPIEEYDKTTPPHVKAARMLKVIDSNIIEYVMTLQGPMPVSVYLEKKEKKELVKLDYSHYVDKQIKPIADSVLSIFNENFDDVIGDSTQVTLNFF